MRIVAAILICLTIVAPCVNADDLSEVLAIEAEISSEMNATSDGGDGQYIITQTDSKGNTWLLVDRGEVQESKYLLAGALFALGIAGWCNQDLYGAIAGTGFIICAATFKF